MAVAAVKAEAAVKAVTAVKAGARRAAAGLLALLMLAAGCARPLEPQAGLSLQASAWQAGQPLTLTLQTHPPQAGQSLAVSVLQPPAGRLPGLGLAGVQLTWLTPEQMQTEALLAAASGASLIGLDFEWRSIEPQPGVFDWQKTDAALELARRYGLRLLPMLVYTPRWASSAAQAPLDYFRAPPADMNAYRDFVYAVVARYKPYGLSPLTADGYGIQDWAMWNEPNVNLPGAAPIPGAFWSGSLEQYIQLLRAGYEGAHAADPACNVLNGALADVFWLEGSADLPNALQRFYDPNGDGDAADGARPYFDTLNIHLYQLDAPDAAWYEGRLSAVERIMRRFGDGERAIWISETGYGTAGSPSGAPYVDEAAQARAVNMIARLGQAHPQVQRVLWWSLRDYYADTSAANEAMEAHYGLLHSDFSPKPAYWAFARLAGPPGRLLKLGGVTDEQGQLRLNLPASFTAPAGLYLVLVQPPDGAAPLVQGLQVPPTDEP